MRKALVTLSGAGIIASLVLASCVVKESDDDDDDGGSAGKSSTTTKTGSGNATSDSATGKGGNVTNTGAQTSAVVTTGGSTSVATGTGGASGTAEPACPDLMAKLSQGSNACSTSEQAASYARINMLIVLDKSLSMNKVPAGDTQTKWAGATAALAAALSPKETLVSYGFMLYPYVKNADAQLCELPGISEDAVNVKVAPAADTVPLINALMAATAPSGGTPTARALKAAHDYYTGGSGLALEGKKYVLLVTDGGPNCNSSATASCDATKCTMNLDGSCSAGVTNCCDKSLETPGGVNPLDLCLDDASVTAQIDALRAANINTFVIGIPGTEAYASYLDVFALSGGVPLTPTTEKPHQYYEVKSQAELVKTFQDITTSLVRDCTVHLKEAPKDLMQINVAIDCSEVPEKTAEGTVNWSYSNPTGTDPVIEILGARCDAIRAAGVKRIDVVNGCPRIMVE